ncbi:MAG: DNA-binding transcriptional regulator [Thermoguttaceae bacterium]
MSTHPRPPVRHIALACYPVAIPWMAMLTQGVTDYAAEHGGWSLTVSPPSLGSAAEEPLTLQSLRGWPGDGVIAAIASEADLRAAMRLGKPVVNIAAVLSEMDLPCVTPDHQAMGRLAAQHLLDCGLRRLAYLGIEGLWYSQQRQRGFAELADKAGVPCETLEIPRNIAAAHSWREQIAPLGRWLKTLRTPVGLLAVHDYRARAVVDECRRLGLDVPHDVAVLGIDNDLTVCEFSRPTLTSVSRDPRRQGYVAAQLLDDLMAGRPVFQRKILTPPQGVVARQSTDTVVVENVHVAAAAHFIHDHLDEPFGVDRVVQATAISRRQLEIHFRRVLGCTVYDYLCRQRCRRATQLLADKNRVKFRTLARTCGFSSVEHLRLVFRRQMGVTPQQYRKTALAKTL